jgi:hypothetical protein
VGQYGGDRQWRHRQAVRQHGRLQCAWPRVRDPATGYLVVVAKATMLRSS